jgi:hypothetical protein
MINKLKIEDAGKLIMPAGKFLVEQMKERKHTVTRQIPKPIEEKQLADGTMDPVRDLEEVKQREPYYVQFFKILAAPTGETEYMVGDVVCAAFTAGATFDLINKTKVVNKFDIICKFVD